MLHLLKIWTRKDERDSIFLLRTRNSISFFGLLVCPSVHPSVMIESKGGKMSVYTFLLRTHNSIRGFVHPSVRPSIGPSISTSWKVGKWAFLKTFCVCLGVCGIWGVDGGWTPLPTRPQRYCDPVSLVEMQSEAQFIKRIRASKLYRVFAIFRKFVPTLEGCCVWANWATYPNLGTFWWALSFL